MGKESRLNKTTIKAKLGLIKPKPKKSIEIRSKEDLLNDLPQTFLVKPMVKME